MVASVARLASIALAVVVAIALPLGNLRTQRVELHCCCPSVEQCKCPDHDTPPAAPTLGACHRTLDTFATPAIAAFVPPVRAMTTVVQRMTVVAHAALPLPHAPPPPRRPDAPS